ncbi:MAG: hypothetical protein HY700_11015 [Gemmatimonadetes bacterium]|nr:hypothetical protein [Gemmatimonadota bacterium]
MSDPRVRHYWDADETIGQRYAKALFGADMFALWDFYLLYDRDAVWRGDSLPTPHLWMHQLTGLDPARHLDAGRFADEAERLLGERPSERPQPVPR